MKKNDFITAYGNEELKVTKDYLSKTIARNYGTNDAIIEFVDNSLDARCSNEQLKVNIEYDSINHTLTIKDNGIGISDFSRIMELGGSSKTNSTKKFIGKFGVGIKGAISFIACYNRFNKDEMTIAKIESYYNGSYGVKHIAFDTNNEPIIGKTEFYECNNDMHGTIITFSNIVINNLGDINDSLEEKFELPLLGYNEINMSIIFQGRPLGKTGKKTFVGDEEVETILVGNHKTDIKYRIIGGTTKDDRSFEEAALRIYDKETGRLLGKSKDFWKWFANKEAQQNICGIRIGMFIESSIQSYNKFGIKPEKTGVNYHKYFKQADFSVLSDYLKSIYNQASKTKPNTEISVQKYGSKTFQPVTKLGSDMPYLENGDVIFYKSKLNNKEIIELILENITLKKKAKKTIKKFA